MKPQIYKVGINWILWLPGERLYTFASWHSAMAYALERKGQAQARVAGHA